MGNSWSKQAVTVLWRVLIPRRMLHGVFSALFLFLITAGVVISVSPLMMITEAKAAFFPLIVYGVLVFNIFAAASFLLLPLVPRLSIWFASFIYLSLWIIEGGWAIWLFLVAWL